MRFSLQPFIASWVILALVLFGTTSPTTAGLVAFESFDYEDGDPLAGENGGFGWSGGWTHVNGTAPTINNGVATLRFSNSTGPEEYRSQINRRLSSSLGGNDTTTWLRFDSQYFNTANPAAPGPFGGLRLMNGENVSLQIGKYNGQLAWSIGGKENDQKVSVTNNTDLWIKITHFAGNDTIRMWLNPPQNSATEANLGSPVVTLDTMDINFNGISLHGDSGNMGFGATHTWTFDNIRIGTSFAAMTAVPEPSSLLMVGLIVAGLGAVRRRTV